VLKIEDLEVAYNGVVQVLHGVSLEVPAGQIVALLGPNGAGKSTTLKAISGLLATEHGKVTAGRVTLDGERLDGRATDAVVRRGVFHVVEGRRVFEDLTVEENLMMGGYTRSDRAGLRRDEALCYELFPKLQIFRRRLAGYLSGGEQQMVAIGRALMARPRLILLDEPSLGLAPLMVQEIFRILKRINQEQKTTLLLVEQNARLALASSQSAYILESGKVVLHGPSTQLAADPNVREYYLGGGHGTRKDYRALKAYRKRRSWGE
jgi:branched-chain amino acid transport system ATP-binding protein